MSILGKLLARKSQRQAEHGTAWQSLVLNVESGALSDPDEILERLEAVKKTPEELQQSLDVLAHRRADHKALQQHDQAEAELHAAREKRAAIQAERTKLLEKLDAKDHTAFSEFSAAEQKLHAAVDARKRLIDGASPSVRRAAFSAIEAEVSEAREALRMAEKAVKDRDAWILHVESLGDAAASGDLELLAAKRSGLKELQKSARDASNRLVELTRKLDAATETLTKPEAGI